MGEVRGCPSCDDFENDRLPPCPLACMSDKCKAKRKPIINIHHKPVIWILGGPGSGKGTQCQLLKQKYGFNHLSTGDLLRAEVLSGSERAKCLHNIMTRGGLVPNDIVLSLLREEMKKLHPTSKGFLIDGYPREKHQGAAFEKAVSPVSLIIYLEASLETMLKRLKSRAAAAAMVRLDDNDAAFKHRIDTFMHNNHRILSQYADKVQTINAEKAVQEVFVDIQQYIDPIVQKTNLAFAAHSAALLAASGVKLTAEGSAASTPAPKSALKPTPPAPETAPTATAPTTKPTAGK